MSAAVWAFVSGSLAHAWVDDGDDMMASVCGNRAERRSTIERSEKTFRGRMCERCRRRVGTPARPRETVQLAWPD